MATMRDVADRAGVSTATVSYVVNGGPRPVSAEMEARVVRAMEELGYRPNKMAQKLARKKSRAVAIIVPNNADAFFAQLARSVEDAAYAAGFNLIVCNSVQSVERELDYFSLLIDKHVDGILLTTSGISKDDLNAMIVKDIPVVILDREIEGIAADTVIFDNFSAGRQATEHLIGHGHQAIAFLSGPGALVGALQRTQGYKQCLHDHGIPMREEWIGRADYTFDGGYRAMKVMLARSSRPTAVVASNDEMAVAAIHAALEQGLSVPQDLAVIGMGDSFAGRIAIPPLTTVFTGTDEMGRRGAQMLLERIDGSAPLAPRRAVLETGLVIRESCGCRARNMP